MQSKNRVEVRICGKDYIVVGYEPEEYIQRVGLYVDKKMSEILKGNSKLSTSMAAVLTAMNIADEYFKCHESEAALKNEVKRLSEELENLKEEKRRIAEECSKLASVNSALQLELAKKEAELKEVRNSFEKVSRTR